VSGLWEEGVYSGRGDGQRGSVERTVHCTTIEVERVGVIAFPGVKFRRVFFCLSFLFLLEEGMVMVLVFRNLIHKDKMSSGWLD
jgi:hypothetical protein